ncbi:hypothetical protein [Streptomyces sp. GC420]|uniref:hypothetical protein n=1 Tax=Streptomyces sp. GC420 TaxID=2697568 RepID=UPI001414D388|nr:hypothetical protein [Streptomyces sp. GC420]NBM16039.1 hypothetical protein [Streptomyces sp. GC420]
MEKTEDRQGNPECPDPGASGDFLLTTGELLIAIVALTKTRLGGGAPPDTRYGRWPVRTGRADGACRRPGGAGHPGASRDTPAHHRPAMPAALPEDRTEAIGRPGTASGPSFGARRASSSPP